MVSETTATPWWRGSLGIVLLTLSTVAFAVALWQVTRLDREAALDPAAMNRERLVVTMSERVVVALRSIFAYQQAVALAEHREQQPALRAIASRNVKSIVEAFRNAPVAAIAPADRGRSIAQTWAAAAAARGPAALPALHTSIVALENALQSMEDASNLTYDPSVTAQNLADARVIELPAALSRIARVQVFADLATKNGRMTLPERFIAGSNVSSVRSLTDLSSDNIPQVAGRLAELMPARAAELSRLPLETAALAKRGAKFADLLTNSLLLKPVPALSRSTVDADANALSAAALRAFEDLGAALDASLENRGALDRARRGYVNALYVIAALFLAGAMIVIAQIVARRDRLALRHAREESARLTAELARQHAEEALRLSEAQYRTIFDGAAVGIAVVDRSGALVDANEVFRSMFDDSLEAALEGHETQMGELFAGTRDTFEFEQHTRSPVGREVWTDVTVSIVNGPDGSPSVAILMFRDKTELKHSERRLQHDKTHDALTGLPNRQLFEQHLQRRFAEASALLDSFFAVLFVDLEHFKDVNESMGHAAGDLALMQIAGRTRSSVDARDVVARLGSDEFAILIQSLGDILHVESVARRVLNNLSKPIAIGSKSVYLGASIGIAIGSSSYERAEDVMRDAEIAMQHAKSGGGTRYALFDSKMHSRAQKRMQLSTDLRLAIERNEFRLLYQPVVGINDGRLVGCEALIRWDHPTEGELNPTEFIGIAEQTGLAAAIGRFVTRTAAEQLAAWRRNRGGEMDFMMHVNVSAAEITDPDFERNLAQVVEQNGLSPSDFTVEITENVVLDAGTRANVVLERVRERGFKICIDDFGTGYSSLRYLQQFKVDAIKIDRSFVSGTDGELASEPIVRTLMTLAEAFDVLVVAEGVESARQRDLLRNAGCRFAQGYMYARPLSAADIVALYPEVLARATRSASA